jgi:transposase-like protein
VRRDQHDALGAIIRSIFTAPDGDEARRRLRDAVEQLERRLPKVAALLEADVLAFYAFPAEHWRRSVRRIRLSASTARSAGAPTS